jgi:hypothetical protein
MQVGRHSGCAKTPTEVLGQGKNVTFLKIVALHNIIWQSELVSSTSSSKDWNLPAPVRASF